MISIFAQIIGLNQGCLDGLPGQVGITVEQIFKRKAFA